MGAVDSDAAITLSPGSINNAENELAAECLDEHDFNYLMILLVQEWFALVPPGSQPPFVDFDDLAEAFETAM